MIKRPRNSVFHLDFCSSLLILLFFSGFLVGVGTSAVGHTGVPVQEQTGFSAAFSGFLFEFVPFLLVIYLFGMTFLGIAVIPAVLFLKGFLLGAPQISTLVHSGTAVYIRQLVTYLPAAAMCSALLIGFSAQALPVSFKFFRSVFGHTADISTAGYGVKFLMALIMCIALGLFRCLCLFSLQIFS